MKNGRGGGLELIFLNQVPRFRIGTCLGGGLELGLNLSLYFFYHSM